MHKAKSLPRIEGHAGLIRPHASGAGRRVLFVNRYFVPDHAATGQLLGELAAALADDGWRVTVVTGFSRHGAREPKIESAHGLTVYRIRATQVAGFGLAGRAVDYVTFSVAALWRLLWIVRRGDIVVVKTDPPLLSIVVEPIVRLRRAHLVNWLQDVYPEIAESLGFVHGRFARALLPRLTRWRNRSLRRAAANVVLGSDMARHVSALGVPGQRIAVVHNWSTGESVFPVARTCNRLRKAWQLDDQFIVAHSGNLGRAHDHATFLAAIEALDHEGAGGATAGIHWLFIGGGIAYEALRHEVAGRGITNVSFKPHQSRAQLAQSLSVADVHLVTLRPCLSRLIVPSKLYGCLAAGRPTIFVGRRESEIGDLILANDCGFVIDDRDHAGLARAIRGLAADPERGECMGANARRVFLERFDFQHAYRQWADLLDQIGSQQSH